MHTIRIISKRIIRPGSKVPGKIQNIKDQNPKYFEIDIESIVSEGKVNTIAFIFNRIFFPSNLFLEILIASTIMKRDKICI